MTLRLQSLLARGDDGVESSFHSFVPGRVLVSGK